MRVLVTGAGGLLGKSVLARAAGRLDCVGVTSEEMDVTDETAVRRVVAELAPDVVLHLAAYTRVDDAEREPERAAAVNRDGTAAVARAAASRGARLAYVSTDYVFDGEKRSPYDEEDEPRPLGRYGWSKWEGERCAAALGGPGTLIVRTAWLYGRGKGFVDWARAAIETGETVPVVADQVGSPTYAVHAAEALVTLVESGASGTFHFANRGEASWLELARAVAEALGRPARLTPVTAAAVGRRAPRPAYSALAVDKYERTTGRRVAHWRDALAEYLRR